MDEATWLTSTDTAAMLAHFDASRATAYMARHSRLSDRKLRLWATACIVPSGCAVYSEEKAATANLNIFVVHMLICCREDRKPQVDAVKAALLRDIIGNPWKPVTLPRSWLTPSVLALARDAYEERGRKCPVDLPHAPPYGTGIYNCSTCDGTGRIDSGHLDPGTLGILADALEESGCLDLAILGHLRSPCPHVRGCWCLDLILGKE